ncbi:MULTISPECIES: type IV secretion system protein [Kribbella]|uniref:TrbL/VirB6 plasmid conjugal transfer protein n=1 Tax=Kribbella karoonensis TaxID=324851 RepID=A0ABN2DFK7_9ACTN
MCGKMDLGCYIKDGFQSVATNAVDQLRQEVSKGALSTLDSMTFWLRPDTPAVANEQTWANSPTVEFLHSSLLGVTGAVFAVAIIIAGMRIAWEQRAKPLQDLLKTMLTFVVVAGMGTATLQLLISWSDGFSVAIIDKVAHGMSLASAFGGPVSGDGKVQSLVADSMPAVLAILSSLMVIVASLIQIVLMLVRSALLVLLAGAFPLAAAATNTEIGRNWFRKFCGWSLAFVAYKPAAALVYAAAMKVGHDHAAAGGSGGNADNGVVPAMTGMMMLLLAIVALPALLRFMVPVTAAVAGGGSATGSSVADPGGMATGAVNVGSSAGGSARGAAGATAGSTGGGGGATGAALAGGKAAGAVAGPAGVGLAAARKAAGGVAGAASHSAGESGGGAVTTPSASGPMAGRSGSRSSRLSHSQESSAQDRTPEPVGPIGAG